MPQQRHIKIARSALVALCLALLTALVAACAGSSPGQTTSGQSTSASGALVTPKAGGMLTIAIAGESNNLDPANQAPSNTLSSGPMAAIFGLLDYVDPSDGGAIKMSFAKSITAANSTNTVWNLVLQPNLTFSDGTPYNAAAVEYNIKRMAEPALGSSVAGIAASLKMKVINATTLQFTLPTANAHFPALVSQDFPYIGSPTAEQREGTKFGDKPVGAGPFLFQQWVVGSKLVLTRNPHYYIKGEPYLSGLTFLTIANEAQIVNSMISGATQFTTLSSPESVHQVTAAGLNTSTNVISGGDALYMNNQTPPFNNPIARQAIALALNRNTITAATSPGSPTTQSIFASSSPYYDSKYTWAAPNHAKAQQLFNELASEGKPLKFTMIVFASSVTEPIGQSVQSQLASFKNVTITVQDLLGGAFIERYFGGDFQMANADVTMESPIPTLCDTFSTTGIGNFFKWNDPIVDKACADIASTDNAAQNQASFNTIMQQIALQNPIISTTALQFTSVWPKNVVDVHPIEFGEQPQWNLIGYKS
jgi:peptide/nickel transport system substrate-binding protein